jgi:AcrR family transcriptional regulator
LTVKTEPFSLVAVPENAARPVDPPNAKRRQILAGARDAFGELGFERASVDLVAARAGVSKATVYNHFRDKRALFMACFFEDADDLRQELSAALSQEPAGDVESALQSIGEKLLQVLVSPPIVSLYRHTMAEVGRLPEIGEWLFERGPDVGYRMIGAYLQRWHEKGALQIDDARAAAVQFHLLCQGEVVVRARLGVDERPPREVVAETVRRAVRTFLRAYAR